MKYLILMGFSLIAGFGAGSYVANKRIEQDINHMVSQVETMHANTEKMKAANDQIYAANQSLKDSFNKVNSMAWEAMGELKRCRARGY